MKKFLVIFLAMALLTSAMFSVFGISNAYLISPIPYFERVVNVIGNYPETKVYSYNEAWAASQPDYVKPSTYFPLWQPVTIDSLLDVPSAISIFMNNLIEYMRAFFQTIGNIFPIFWNNIKEAFRYYLTPITVTVENVASVLDTFFSADDWLISLGLALVPVDWLQMVDDGKDVDIPLFGNVSERPLVEYFTKGE